MILGLLIMLILKMGGRTILVRYINPYDLKITPFLLSVLHPLDLGLEGGLTIFGCTPPWQDPVTCLSNEHFKKLFL